MSSDFSVTDTAVTVTTGSQVAEAGQNLVGVSAGNANIDEGRVASHHKDGIASTSDSNALTFIATQADIADTATSSGSKSASAETTAGREYSDSPTSRSSSDSVNIFGLSNAGTSCTTIAGSTTCDED